MDGCGEGIYLYLDGNIPSLCRLWPKGTNKKDTRLKLLDDTAECYHFIELFTPPRSDSISDELQIVW